MFLRYPKAPAERMQVISRLYPHMEGMCRHSHDKPKMNICLTERPVWKKEKQREPKRYISSFPWQPWSESLSFAAKMCLVCAPYTRVHYGDDENVILSRLLFSSEVHIGCGYGMPVYGPEGPLKCRRENVNTFLVV